MPVTKVLSDSGSWSLNLRPDTPQAIVDACDVSRWAFSHVVVTPSWIDPTAVHYDDLYGMSIYSGILFARRDFTIGGHHVTAHMKDPQGIALAHKNPGGGGIAMNFAQWVWWLTPPTLRLGSPEDLLPGQSWGMVPVTGTYRDNLENILDFIAGNASSPIAEGLVWRVDDQLRLAAGRPNWFGSWPLAVLTPHFDGPDPLVDGLNATLEVDDDAGDYASEIIYQYDGGEVVIDRGGFLPHTSPYRRWDGEPIVRSRVLSDSSIGSSAAADRGRAEWRKSSKTRRHITARSTRYAVLADLNVGSRVYAWDPMLSVVDLSQALPWRGSVISPVSTRVMSVTMPVEEGMGVYLIHHQGHRVHDLTRWVLPESPGATLDLGSYPRNYVR